MAPTELKQDDHVNTMNAETDDIAVGSQRKVRAYTARTFFRSVLFQMILFGALSFVGPAMSDAITNLGGGGLSSPWLANLANSLSYTMSFLSTIIGGPIINKIGIKWACLIAAAAMPLHGSAYYVQARFKNEPYLLSANVIKGFAAGLLYVGETTAMLSYPKPEDKGFYLGIWSAMRNSGSVIGGAINFSTNSKTASRGGIAWATYLIFIGFECTGIIWALLLTKTEKVRRRDGSHVALSESVSWKKEFIALWRYLQEPKTWLVFVPAFYSFFYGGTMSTYLTLHFSVRARALSSFLVPSLTIPSVIIFGKFLDNSRLRLRTRAYTALLMWLVPQLICFILIAVEYHILGNKTALDYTLHTKRWARAYIPYLVLFVVGYWCQLMLYWILGTFSNETAVSSRAGGVFRAFEVAGQAVSYGLSSSQGMNVVVPLYVNCCLLVLVVPSMLMLISKMPKVMPTEDLMEVGDDSEKATAVDRN